MELTESTTLIKKIVMLDTTAPDPSAGGSLRSDQQSSGRKNWSSNCSELELNRS